MRKVPGVMHGLPQRIQGLGEVSQQTPDSKGGLPMYLAQAAAEKPEASALIYEDRHYTYAQLNQWVNRLANYLSASGTGKGDVVAIFVENRPELLASIAAVARLGAVASLINTSQRDAVLQHSITLVSPHRMIVGAELIAAAMACAAVLPQGEDERLFWSEDAASCAPKGWCDLDKASAQCSIEPPPKATVNRASEPFCYFYTSGTTGLPKAAVMTHGRFMKAYSGVGKASIQLHAKDRVLISLPFYHATALAIGWGAVIAGRAAMVMVRHFSASRFWPQVHAHQVTAFCYVGELCRYLLALPESPDDKAHSIRMMFGNGLRPNVWTAFKQRYGIEKVMEFYGSSEGNVGFLNLFNFDCTVGFTTVPYAIVEYDLEDDEVVRHADGFMRKVRKGQSGLLLGEITDKSPFDGYTDPEKTEKTILRNVFKNGDAWFNTGDLMRDQGFRHAQFVDRLGDTFRWKGENVSTAEVENVLAGDDSVLDGVVYGVEIPNTNGRAGMACIRLQEGRVLDPAKLFARLSEGLPSYAVPVFVRVAEKLETTGTHKYKKTDLKNVAFDPKKTQDQLWVNIPGESRYQTLDQQLFDAISRGEFRF